MPPSGAVPSPGAPEEIPDRYVVPAPGSRPRGRMRSPIIRCPGGSHNVLDSRGRGTVLPYVRKRAGGGGRPGAVTDTREGRMTEPGRRAGAGAYWSDTTSGTSL
ncbi:hypothetical protein IBTHAUMO2_1070001 [Nitrosopumilaceae archaeon]|nr:hypothetical protein IBTHAUMO2_1070001 [Nitrosopumilaceae archaeon]